MSTEMSRRQVEMFEDRARMWGVSVETFGCREDAESAAHENRMRCVDSMADRWTTPGGHRVWRVRTIRTPHYAGLG